YSGITLVGKRARIPADAVIGRNCKIMPAVRESDFPSRVIQSGTTVEAKAQAAPFRV
ncbi:MAG: hypothetical protein HY684_00210, partial [Chloroflexi bacterium]|nr:hypothetical protein [Chloroflexota bacterium]